MKKLFWLIILLNYINLEPLFGQDKKIPLSISIFNNGTSLPGTGYLGVFSKTIHPGITLGTYHLYHTGQKHEFFQTFKAGYYYHRFVQHGIQLYSEAGYRYLTQSGIYGEALLGAGYLHSFPNMEVFVFKDGRYVKKRNFGKPQFMISTEVGGGYDLEARCKIPLRVFLLYQFWMQTPFVNKYVPLLPNTALHLGVRYMIRKKNKTGE